MRVDFSAATPELQQHFGPDPTLAEVACFLTMPTGSMLFK
jgi:hypothetical protein